MIASSSRRSFPNLGILVWSFKLSHQKICNFLKMEKLGNQHFHFFCLKSAYILFLFFNIYAKALKADSLKRQQSFLLNTSYFTDSDIIFTLKMESVSKNTIFGLKMMVKSGLEKNLFQVPPCGRLFFLTS